MRYLLVCITHHRSEHLDNVLAAFREMVTPGPAQGLLWVDGEDIDDAALTVVAAHGYQSWIFSGSSYQRGFCLTVGDVWQEACEEAERLDCDYVFWLENDFLFRRPVDLEPLAQLLDANDDLAQIAFMRNAVNPVEAAAGGLFESRRSDYEPQFKVETTEVTGLGARMRGHQWLKHRSYFTTNPSLMRRSFMEQYPFPESGRYCEGHYGLYLIEHGISFGVWGDGKPWVEHVGVRTGKGY